MPTRASRALAALAAALTALPLLLHPPAAAAQVTEWTFRVTADPAPVRARPDPAATQVDSFAKGLTVKSYAAEGAWIRFIITRQDGSVVIGFVAASDLELLDSKVEEAADFWTDPGDDYRGAGLVFRFAGGYGTLGGGDVPRGTETLYRDLASYIDAWPGYAFIREDPLSFKTRTTLIGEALYHLTPRFGLGLGASLSFARAFGERVYEKFFPYESKLLIEPNIRTIAYFLTAAYLLPLNKLLSVRLSGGPLLAQTRYLCHGISPVYERRWELVQQVNGWGLGAHAAAALEINLNEKAAIFLEAAGRAGTVRGFEGMQDVTFTAANGALDIERVSGTLYAVETASGTRLVVLADPALGPGPAREAVYSLAGIEARFGFRIRF